MWKGFLHIKYHHRKSSPEGNSVPKLSESGLKPSGAGPGVGKSLCCCSAVPLGLHSSLGQALAGHGSHQHSAKLRIFNLQTSQKQQHNKSRGCPMHLGSSSSGVWLLEFTDSGWKRCHGSCSAAASLCLREVAKSDHKKEIFAFLLCAGQILFPSEVVHEEPTAPSTLPQHNKDTDVHCRLHDNFSCVFKGKETTLQHSSHCARPRCSLELNPQNIKLYAQ